MHHSFGLITEIRMHSCHRPMQYLVVERYQTDLYSRIAVDWWLPTAAMVLADSLAEAVKILGRLNFAMAGGIPVQIPAIVCYRPETLFTLKIAHHRFTFEFLYWTNLEPPTGSIKLQNDEDEYLSMNATLCCWFSMTVCMRIECMYRHLVTRIGCACDTCEICTCTISCRFNVNGSTLKPQAFQMTSSG